MLKPMRCIRLGEILLDENRRTFILCTQCFTEYEYLHDFQEHMDGCTPNDETRHSLQGIFGNNISLIFPVTKKGQQTITSYAKKDGRKYHVYKYNGFKKIDMPKPAQPTSRAGTSATDDDFMDLIKIEEELLDPRWYSELGNEPSSSTPSKHQQTPSYNELVEAMTPFVHFKENVKSNNDGNSKNLQKAKDSAGSKPQILNGAKSGHLLKSKQLTRGAEIKTYVLEKPRSPSTTTAPNPLVTTNHIRKLPVSSSSTNGTAKLPVANANSPRLPVAHTNTIKSTVNNGCVKSSTSNTSNKAKLSSANSNSANITLTSTDPVKLPVSTASLSTNRSQLPEAGNLNKEIQEQTQKQQTQQCLLLLPPKTEIATIVPVSNLATAHTIQVQKQHIVANIPTTIHTETNQNVKTLKRMNGDDIVYLSSQQLLEAVSPSISSSPSCFPANPKKPKTSPSKIGQTQQILEKLQTLGLQVKRKEQPTKRAHQSNLPVAIVDPEKEKALQILKKLQSKGMNVKIIQPSKQTSGVNVHTEGQSGQQQEGNVTHVSTNIPVNRKLIIKKIN